ncbi:MAG: ATP-binding protein [Candidatus Heimdallarchaeota archaeon]|nr:ATP-binding protein [Candidatus Heimdallarchaeota archaeon]MCK4612722.1 ATP-binding protein [Candidatus Heimdallarchaeota archaeon]
MISKSAKDNTIIFLQFLKINFFKAVLPLLTGILIYYLAYYFIWLLWLKTVLMVGGVFFIIQGAVFLGLSYAMRKDLNTLKRFRFLEGLKKEALDGKLENFLTKDEEEIIDRKRQMITDPKKLAKLITAMSNRFGGVIIFGVDDFKKPSFIDGEEREKIEKQIGNICTTSISPKVIPEPISIIKENDLGILTVFIPRAKKEPIQVINDGIYYHRIGSSNRIMEEDEVKKYRKIKY